MKIEDLPTADGVDETDWRQAFGIESDYGTPAENGPQPFTPDQVDRVIWWHGDSSEGYASASISALFQLAGGKYATLVAWCDTTGWDCRSSVTWSKQFDTLAEALSQGLDSEGRAGYVAAGSPS